MNKAVFSSYNPYIYLEPSSTTSSLGAKGKAKNQQAIIADLLRKTKAADEKSPVKLDERQLSTWWNLIGPIPRHAVTKNPQKVSTALIQVHCQWAKHTGTFPKH